MPLGTPTREPSQVERSFNVFKQWRALATRYDKLALTYRGGVVLRAIVIWVVALQKAVRWRGMR
uniref:transposase n=1 Tax=Georgenia sp. M64 TaxID=3120520 RepID=UPI0040491431